MEVEWTVGHIPMNDQICNEMIIRYDTDIRSASKSYTDTNGCEVLERVRDYRPTWNNSAVETVSGNYYPINTRIWIKDGQRQLTILTGNIYTDLKLFFTNIYNIANLLFHHLSIEEFHDEFVRASDPEK